MREILFRGKRIDNGEWVEGWYVPPIETDWHKFGTAITYICESGYLEDVTVDPTTVGQYTGLTDKNGKRIFEGDVCQIKNHRLIGDLPFVIEWEDFAYNGWTWRDLDEVGAVDSFTNGAARHCEVIGNIHDNPELVKEEAHA